MSVSELVGTSSATLTALLERAAAAAPERTFLVTEAGETTYGHTVERSAAAARTLRALGVRHGDRVVAFLPNSPKFVMLFLGCARLGAVFVPVNPRGTAAELAGILGQAAPRLVVVDGSTAALARDAVDRAPVVDVALEDVDMLDGDMQGGDPGNGATTVPAAGPGDTLVLIPTSGSTSAPKLVAHRHSSVVLSAEGFPSWLGLSAADRLLTPLPLFHANALIYSLLGSLAAGASLVLLPRFSARRFWDQTREFGATQFNLMGNMGEILLRGQERPDDADNPVRLCYSAWAPSEQRHREFERRFGVNLTIGYGLSETPYGTAWPLGEPKPFGTIGRLRQHPVLGRINEARVVDEERRPVPPNTPGVLWLRNPAIMQGYYGMADETAAVLADGWLDTGDIVRVDENDVFTYVGRRKDIIRRSGENFAPVEVEEVLDAHPAVVASAVVAVPSPMSDDDAKAFVVLRPDSATEAADLVAWCRDRLAHFKLPRYVELVGELPMTETGRIAKGRLPRERTGREQDLESHRTARPQ